MLDFGNLKAVSIPEGSVAKITRKSDGVTLWEKIKSRIPGEYQEVEYIYIPDTAYINTEWTPTEGTTFNIIFKATKNTYAFGTGSLPRLAMYYSGTGSSQIYNTSNTADGIHRCSILANEIVDIETYSTYLSAESYVIVNGEKIINDAQQTVNFDTTLPMLLGAWQYNASTIRQGEIYLYYAKANVGGVDVFEMIPCYRKSDNAVGMYDTVSEKFFTNAGTGSFTKGADV